MINTQQKRSSGFTLIELLVVIAIIAILAAILFPVFAQAKAAAKKATAISNCKELNLGQIMYSNDYDDQYVPYFSYWNPATYTTGAPSEYWPGLISPYIQKANTGATSAGGQQILAQDLSKIFFDPIESLTFPTTGGYGNIASWGISDDIVNWWEPSGVSTTYIPVNGSTVNAPANALIFVETWDWLSASATSDPGYPGSALALSIFDNNGPQPYNPNYTHDGQPAPRNGAIETVQSTYNQQYHVRCNPTGVYPCNENYVYPGDPKGQNVVGFCDGHVKSINVGQLSTTPSYWSISGTGQWP
jgi:prepilin-type N-terminal cleavage/methylation domain-containing protein/prepilin-type processing-associated H-X9-DG protein